MEIWKDISGYDGKYQISNLSRIKSLISGNEKILSTYLNYSGYERCSLGWGKNKKSHSIHRLVAIAFIPNPENKPCVNHINRNRSDNSIENLEWVTHKENAEHAISFVDTYIKSRANHYNSKRVIQKDLNGNNLKTWGSVIEASISLGISKSSISDCARGKVKAVKNYVFQYY